MNTVFNFLIANAEVILYSIAFVSALFTLYCVCYMTFYFPTKKQVDRLTYDFADSNQASQADQPVRHDFKGLGSWFEVFKVGQHTDSSGKIRDWSNEQLAEIASNYSADNPPPAVFGHPKDNSGRFADVELKHEGQSLFARLKNIAAGVEGAFKSGEINGRSISVAKNKHGKLTFNHLGFLGSSKPALDLPAIEFSEAGQEYATAVTFATPAEKTDLKFDSVRYSDAVVSFKEKSEQSNLPAGHYSYESKPAIDHAENAQNQALQNRIDELEKEQRQQKITEFKSWVDQQKFDGRLSPSQAEGVIEFCAAMSSLKAAQFNFSSAGTQLDAVSWFKKFVEQLPVHSVKSELAQSRVGNLSQQVAEYMSKHPQLTPSQAVNAVSESNF